MHCGISNGVLPNKQSVNNDPSNGTFALAWYTLINCNDWYTAVTLWAVSFRIQPAEDRAVGMRAFACLHHENHRCIHVYKIKRYGTGYGVRYTVQCLEIKRKTTKTVKSTKRYRYRALGPELIPVYR